MAAIFLRTERSATFRANVDGHADLYFYNLASGTTTELPLA